MAQLLHEISNPASFENRRKVVEVTPVLKEKTGIDLAEYGQNSIETGISMSISQTNNTQTYKLLNFEEEQKILQTGLTVVKKCAGKQDRNYATTNSGKFPGGGD